MDVARSICINTERAWSCSALSLEELESDMTDISSSWRIRISVLWALANAHAENCATL